MKKQFFFLLLSHFKSPFSSFILLALCIVSLKIKENGSFYNIVGLKISNSINFFCLAGMERYLKLSGQSFNPFVRSELKRERERSTTKN